MLVFISYDYVEVLMYRFVWVCKEPIIVMDGVIFLF